MQNSSDVLSWSREARFAARSPLVIWVTVTSEPYISLGQSALVCEVDVTPCMAIVRLMLARIPGHCTVSTILEWTVFCC